jgi:hypothetical protein
VAAAPAGAAAVRTAGYCGVVIISAGCVVDDWVMRVTAVHTRIHDRLTDARCIPDGHTHTTPQYRHAVLGRSRQPPPQQQQQEQQETRRRRNAANLPPTVPAGARKTSGSGGRLCGAAGRGAAAAAASAASGAAAAVGAAGRRWEEQGHRGDDVRVFFRVCVCVST